MPTPTNYDNLKKQRRENMNAQGFLTPFVNRMIDYLLKEKDIIINKRFGVCKMIDTDNIKMNHAINVLDRIMPVVSYSYDKAIDKRLHFGYIPANVKSMKIINKRNILIIYNISSNQNAMPDNNIYKLIIIGKDSYKIYYSLIKHTKELYKLDNSLNSIYMNYMNNGMYNTSSVICKSDDHIFIKDKDILFKNIDSYLDNAATIQSYGINSCIGILLYGNPGTGKTTLINDICNKYNKKLNRLGANSSRRNYCPLSIDLNTCNINAISNQVGTITVFEEIDCVSLERKPTSGNIQINTGDNVNQRYGTDKTSLRDLLLWMDNPPQEVNMIIATTNHIENLDPALIRDGRFDIKFECSDIDKPLATKMVKSFDLSPSVILKDEEFPINPAYLQGKCIKNLDKAKSRKKKEK